MVTKIMCLIGLMFALCSTSITGQNEFQLVEDMIEDYDLKIRQRPETQSQLITYLEPFQNSDSIVYAILFQPMSCPRCEIGLLLMFDKIKRVDPAAKTLIIACYDNKAASKRYLERKGYRSDYVLYDTCHTYKDIFSFSIGDLSVNYILKLNKKQGVLMAGGNINNITMAFAKELCAYKGIMPMEIFESTESIVPAVNRQQNSQSENLLKYVYNKIDLIPSSDYPISTCSQNKTVLKNDLFIYTDELANGGYVFRVRGNLANFEHFVVADSTEKRMFVYLPDSIYQMREKNGFNYYIANGIDFINDNRLGISYSLPNLSFETEDNIAYYNEPVIIRRKLPDYDAEKILDLDLMPHDGFTYSHFTYFPMNNPNYVLLSCQAYTWPVGMDISYYKGNPDKDPFMDEFYMKRRPYLAIIDLNTGKDIGKIGNLDSAIRKTRTSYFFSAPIADACEGKLIYGNALTGKLYLQKEGDPEETATVISVFDMDTVNMPKLNPDLFYKEEYVMVYDNYFNHEIMNVVLTSDHIHCLVREGRSSFKSYTIDKFLYVCLDHQGHIIKQYPLIPENIDKETVMNMGLTQDGDGVYPYYFGKENNNSFFIKKVKL